MRVDTAVESPVLRFFSHPVRGMTDRHETDRREDGSGPGQRGGERSRKGAPLRTSHGSRRSRQPPEPLTNSAVAAVLQEVADLLEAQQANQFRVAAYRNAAETIRTLSQDVSQLLQREGPAGLVRLPGIGDSLAGAIEQLCTTGRLPLLERLRGENVVESLFATIPSIGPELAERIHHQLGIETLAELEAAARDGSLERIPGIGRKRAQAVRDVVAGRSRYRTTIADAPPAPAASVDQPAVEELLDVDAEYRRKAEADRLTRIAPRRFNPTGAAWLPILHTTRGDRHYTALYSNTARAHELGTTHDWVVIYRDDTNEGRWTVITSQFSDLKGRRIVRGREAECRDFYDSQESAPGSEPHIGPSVPKT